MPLTTSALQIGRSALLSYQAALQVVGNNIANAGNASYTRQSTGLAAIPPSSGTTLQIGNGVGVIAIQRNISDAVESRLRQSRSDRASAESEDAALSRIESILNPLGDSNLASELQAFFDSFAGLQNNPENVAGRRLVLSAGARLAQTIRQTRADLLATRQQANREIEFAVGQANQLAAQVAELNVRIVTAESASQSPAAALRDQRDDLLRQLSEIVGISTREQPGGAVNVYIGNEPLVFFGTSRGLTTTTESVGAGRFDAVVRFTANNGQVAIASGKLAGLTAARDQHVDTQIERLDRFAAALIAEVNRVHSQGQGLSGFTSLTAGYPVGDAGVALNSAAAGLPLAPRSGTFYVDVRNTATGTVVRTAVHVDADGLGGDTTLNSLAADISAAVGNLTATVQADGTLSLSAADGFTFQFASDSSNVLAALGLNAYFSGRDASDIAVSADIAGAPERLAASVSGLPGDGANAGRIAALIEAPATSLGGASLLAFHQGSVGIQAVSAAASRSGLQAADAILSSLVAQREAVSGVNLDEEAVKLVTYQRAYEGAARYLSVVDELLRTLLGLVG